MDFWFWLQLFSWKICLFCTTRLPNGGISDSFLLEQMEFLSLKILWITLHISCSNITSKALCQALWSVIIWAVFTPLEHWYNIGSALVHHLRLHWTWKAYSPGNTMKLLSKVLASASVAAWFLNLQFGPDTGCWATLQIQKTSGLDRDSPRVS